MQSEYRHLKCPGCELTLRVKITEKQHGGTIKVTCPECKQKSRVKVPRPAATFPGTRELGIEFLQFLDLISKMKGGKRFEA